MAQAQFERQWLVEELFLNACAPFLHTEIKKRIHLTCPSCQEYEDLSQTTHSCLYYDDFLIDCIAQKAVIFLEDKRHRIIRKMKDLAYTFAFAEITAMDILEFLGDDEDPFKKIIVFDPWLLRVKSKVKQLKNNSDLSVVKLPKLEESLNCLFDDVSIE
jgi:hypothetical protein